MKSSALAKFAQGVRHTNPNLVHNIQQTQLGHIIGWNLEIERNDTTVLTRLPLFETARLLDDQNVAVCPSKTRGAVSVLIQWLRRVK